MIPLLRRPVDNGKPHFLLSDLLERRNTTASKPLVLGMLYHESPSLSEPRVVVLYRKGTCDTGLNTCRTINRPRARYVEAYRLGRAP